MLTHWLAPFDVCLADAADPALKRASVEILRAEAEGGADSERALRKRSEGLREAGYGGQVPILPGALNLFYHGGAGRERLVRGANGVIEAPAAGERFGAEELGRRIAEEPGRFSPNVLLRPLVESHVFPTLAYVGGPAEMAYFAQAGALFELHERCPPLVVPRFSARLVPAEVVGELEALGWEVDEVERPRHELLERLAAERVPAAVERGLREVREAIAAEYRRLIETAGEVDPTLRGSLGSLRNRSLLLAERAERKVLRAVKRGGALPEASLDRILAHLWPLDGPQERVLNLLPYLAMEGSGLLREIAAAVRFRGLEADPAEVR